MTRLIVCLMLVMPVFFGAERAQPAVAATVNTGTTEQIVEARSRAWVKAALDRNADLFRTFATDDYVMLWVDPATKTQPAHWHVRSRDEWVDMVRTGKVKYQSVEFKNTRVRVNGDIAIFTGEYTQKALGDGTEGDEAGFFVETWAKRGGEWLAVSSVFS
jgi:ketosteroid isomerase-like protein